MVVTTSDLEDIRKALLKKQMDALMDRDEMVARSLTQVLSCLSQTMDLVRSRSVTKKNV